MPNFFSFEVISGLLSFGCFSFGAIGVVARIFASELDPFDLSENDTRNVDSAITLRISELFLEAEPWAFTLFFFAFSLDALFPWDQDGADISTIGGLEIGSLRAPINLGSNNLLVQKLKITKLENISLKNLPYCDF